MNIDLKHQREEHIICKVFEAKLSIPHSVVFFHDCAMMCKYYAKKKCQISQIIGRRENILQILCFLKNGEGSILKVLCLFLD
jgi:hypothetical protein